MKVRCDCGSREELDYDRNPHDGVGECLKCRRMYAVVGQKPWLVREAMEYKETTPILIDDAIIRYRLANTNLPIAIYLGDKEYREMHSSFVAITITKDSGCSVSSLSGEVLDPMYHEKAYVGAAVQYKGIDVFRTDEPTHIRII